MSKTTIYVILFLIALVYGVGYLISRGDQRSASEARRVMVNEKAIPKPKTMLPRSNVPVRANENNRSTTQNRSVADADAAAAAFALRVLAEAAMQQEYNRVQQQRHIEANRVCLSCKGSGYFSTNGFGDMHCMSCKGLGYGKSSDYGNQVPEAFRYTYFY